MTFANVPGLQRLVGFTIFTADVRATAAAYARWLDYVIAEQTIVSPLLARLWGCARLAGRSLALLHAPASPATLLRLVEMPVPPAATPLLGHGWNAMEVLVQDPYALAVQLEGSPFRIVIPPRPLPFDASIHAMQVIGPAGELLYLTALPTKRTILDLNAARTRVDRPFIAILGGPDASAMLSFYSARLRTPVIAPTATIVQIINEQFSLAADQRIALGIVKLPRDCLIEVDEMPPAARPRAQLDDAASSGIAMLSCECADLQTLDVNWRGAPQALQTAPYCGRRAAVTVGAAGEWIELIETAVR